MGSLFGGDEDVPQIPQEDPAVARARALAEARAEQERIKATQAQLAVETDRNKSGETGARSLLGSFAQLSQRLGAG